MHLKVLFGEDFSKQSQLPLRVDDIRGPRCSFYEDVSKFPKIIFASIAFAQQRNLAMRSNFAGYGQGSRYWITIDERQIQETQRHP